SGSAENPRTDGRGIWPYDRPECPHRRTPRSGADRHRRSALEWACARSLGGGELDNLGVMTDLSDPTAAARAAATTINSAAGIDSHDIALVLGSGWGGAADLLGETISEVPAAEVPGFHAPAVEGHGATLRTVRIAASGKHALVLGSRTHYYEGNGVRAVARGVRPAAADPPHTTERATAPAPWPTVCAPRPRPAARPSCSPPAAADSTATGRPGPRCSSPITSTSPAPPPSRARTSSTSPTSPPRACGPSPRTSIRASTRACTPSSAAPTTKPPPRCAWPGSSGPTSSACPPRSRPSPHVRPVSSSWASHW